MGGLRRFLVLVIVCLARGITVAGRLWADEPGGPPLNVRLPTLGGTQFWSDELFFHQWHIQRNVLTGHYRLLDEKDIRHAWGTLTECRTALERIKRDQRLQPMRGKAVILLHGLFNNHLGMASLERYLRDHGGYTVFNVTYPSTQNGVSEHAESLARVIANLDGIEEINFVGHSMGNIVVRHYLADRQRKPDPRLKRMVMLAPPNHGSLAAVVLAQNAVFKTVTGEAGQELGAQWAALEQRLATPDFEFGIIAGGKQDDHGYNPLLPGDNDGTISVDTTRLAGASDFIVLPVLHPLVIFDKTTHECTLRFLKHGFFISAEKRHPLAE
jgi:pimeloyl-ACP methyl ester carboxylesterase